MTIRSIALLCLVLLFCPRLVPCADSSSPKPNRLIQEKSPYLLQHAYDPIDWYPWSNDALDKARKENKPIFLSIGYSACHMCHLMQEESFQDSEVAAMLNETFVSILVDREERPDIDQVYLNAYRMTAGAGGWPLNVIMTPDQKPFYMTTYMPKSDNSELTGITTVITQIKELWKTKQKDALRSAELITSLLQQRVKSTDAELNKKILDSAFQELEESFDDQHSGFGSEPKFPGTHELLFLLRYWKRTKNQSALNMVEKTLQQMRSRGLYDHVGFGFHRYTEDAAWMTPHFEKMLYDQAMHLITLSETFEATQKDEYKRTMEEILSYVERELTDPKGGFYSSEDADSEGEAGTFYLWSADEIRNVLGEKEARWFLSVYNFDPALKFSGHPAEKSILILKEPIKEDKRIEIARQKLFAFRSKRPHPQKDDKILTDWNGLMIAAFAKSARVLNEPKYGAVAKRAADFVLSNLHPSDRILFHRYRNGHVAGPAYVNDYAFLIWGLIELYETTFEVRYLSSAIELNQEMIEHFWDKKEGGFYFSRENELLVRLKEIYDGTLPSGNSVAFWNLLRLARLSANEDLEKKANKIAQLFYGTVKDFPSGYCQFLVALDFLLGPTYEVVIAGNSTASDTKVMLHALQSVFAPRKVVLMRPTEQGIPEILKIAAFTRYQSAKNGKATAYVCLKYVCRAPTTDIQEMLRLLEMRDQSN